MVANVDIWNHQNKHVPAPKGSRPYFDSSAPHTRSLRNPSLSLKLHAHGPLAKCLMHMAHLSGNTSGVSKSSSYWFSFSQNIILYKKMEQTTSVFVNFDSFYFQQNVRTIPVANNKKTNLTPSWQASIKVWNRVPPYSHLPDKRVQVCIFASK